MFLLLSKCSNFYHFKQLSAFICTLILAFLFPVKSVAQKQGSVWYFGTYAGLNFKHGVPVALTDGQLTTTEGCATLCDEDGNLLLYTDGINVWNKQHKNIVNDLNGSPSSTQSGIIVPMPENNDIIYVFTVDEVARPNGLAYTTISLSGNGNEGKVLTKNNKILAVSTEKLTAVKHTNNRDVWILSHLWNSDGFIAFLLTPNGLDAKSIISNTGSQHTGMTSNTVGYMKVSPDATKIAVAVTNSGFVELFNFDASTGVVSNPKKIMEDSKPYGIEFSPDGKKLYVSTYGGVINGLYQYNLSVNDENIIKNSQVFIKESPNLFALQLAQDGKIYVARNRETFLSSIYSPNETGFACNFIDTAVSLAGRRCNTGLPSFDQTFFRTVFFYAEGFCSGQPTRFKYLPTGGIDSFSWNFGNPPSGSNNFSKDTTPTHIYTHPGTYAVILTAWANGKEIVEKQIINIELAPKPNLRDSMFFCKGDSLFLDPEIQADSYLWSNGSTEKAIWVSTAGKHWVQIILGDCTLSDTVFISEFGLPEFNFGDSIFTCEGNAQTLNAFTENATYLWNDGSTSAKKEVTESGIYSVAVSTSCTTVNASVKVEFADCFCYLYVPNAFTPDTNDINEYFMPSVCPTAEYYFSIYNRWGERVFETTDIEKGWNGRFNNQPSPTGLYLYKIYLLEVTGQKKWRNGYFYLIK